MKTKEDGQPLNVLRALARYQTHGGYVWAAVMKDGELLCVPCVRENYRQIFRATRAPARRDGWAVAGFANSGDSESTEHCAHCNRAIWEHDNEGSEAPCRN